MESGKTLALEYLIRHTQLMQDKDRMKSVLAKLKIVVPGREDRRKLLVWVGEQYKEGIKADS